MTSNDDGRFITFGELIDRLQKSSGGTPSVSSMAHDLINSPALGYNECCDARSLSRKCHYVVRVMKEAKKSSSTNLQTCRNKLLLPPIKRIKKEERGFTMWDREEGRLLKRDVLGVVKKENDPETHDLRERLAAAETTIKLLEDRLLAQVQRERILERQLADAKAQVVNTKTLEIMLKAVLES
jgi:hypothetical protein